MPGWTGESNITPGPRCTAEGQGFDNPLLPGGNVAEMLKRIKNLAVQDHHHDGAETKPQRWQLKPRDTKRSAVEQNQSNAWCHHGLEFHATNALLRSHTLWWAWGCFGKGQSLCPEASQRGSDLSDLSSIYWKRPQTSSSPLWYQNNPMVLGLKPTCAAKGREKNEDRLAREQALDGHWPRTETTVVKDATSVEPRHVIAIVVSIVGYAAPSTYKSMYIIVYYRITMYVCIYIYSQSFSYICTQAPGIQQ